MRGVRKTQNHSLVDRDTRGGELAAHFCDGGGDAFQRGLITGVPNQTGTSNFTVQVVDGHGLSGSGNFSINSNPYNAPLAIATTALPPANFGEFYTVPLAALVIRTPGSAGTRPW